MPIPRPWSNIQKGPANIAMLSAACGIAPGSNKRGVSVFGHWLTPQKALSLSRWLKRAGQWGKDGRPKRK